LVHDEEALSVMMCPLLMLAPPLLMLASCTAVARPVCRFATFGCIMDRDASSSEFGCFVNADDRLWPRELGL